MNELSQNFCKIWHLPKIRGRISDFSPQNIATVDNAMLYFNYLQFALMSLYFKATC